jgi:small multidrug resistance pump
MMTYLYLILAIASEVIGTSALQASNQLSRVAPVLIMIAAYACAFFFLTQTLRTLPIGIAYAIWSGLGVVAIAVIGVVWFKQALDWPAVVGMSMIVAGVLVIHLFSRTVTN